MQAHRFTLILAAAPSAEQEDTIFELFEGDATVAISNGTPALYVTREGVSMEHTMREVVQNLATAGIEVVKVEVSAAELVGA